MLNDTRRNRLREFREMRGLSQAALVSTINLTRQSVHAIESGKATPAVDVALRMARALDCTVEMLFASGIGETPLATECALSDNRPVANRVALANIAGRWLSYALVKEGIAHCADAIVVGSESGQLQVEPLRPASEATQNVILMGCAPALGLLADRLNAVNGPGRFLWFGTSSIRALEALNQRQAHVVGVHLVDTRTGEANVPDVRRHVQSTAAVVVSLARWEVGLVVPKGNPKRVTNVSHLAKRGVRLVAREPGSGARRLLERELRNAGIRSELVKRATVTVTGHLEVTAAIYWGVADVGIATRDAALAFGLDFLPLTEERYDLVLARDDLVDPRITRLFDVMTAGPLRRELGALGYDLGPAGNRVTEIGLA